MTTTFTGTRTPTSVGGPWKRRTPPGPYELRDFEVQKVGEGVVLVEGTGEFTGLVVEDGVVRDSGRVFNMPDSTVVLTGGLIRNVHATGVDSFLRLKKANGLVVEDCSAVGNAQGSNGVDSQNDFPSGCFTSDHPTADVTYRRVRMSWFVQPRLRDGQYGNGDGFADEEQGYRMRYLQCVASDNLDGGLDTKSHELYVEDFVAERNGRNFRLWGDGMLVDIVSVHPRKAHIWAGGGERLGSYTIERPVFVDDPADSLRPHVDIDPREDYRTGDEKPVITIVDPRDGEGRLLTAETLRVRGPQSRVEVLVVHAEEPALPEPEEPALPLGDIRAEITALEAVIARLRAIVGS